ncbi:MAG: hypothetical protein GC179_22305 [Anaerolineaceae bacterium]|nr:hypothetical protein [Anaerolineaceae bacterium]
MSASQNKNSDAQKYAYQAQVQCQAALKYYQNGNTSGAIKALGAALELDRSLRNDERVRRFASHLVGLSPDKAVAALTDLKTREALITQASKKRPAKSTSLQSKSLWILGSATLFLVVVSVIGLILSGQLKLNALDPFSSQGEVEIHQLATNPEQSYLTVAPIGKTPDDGWPVLVAVHGKGQTGQDMVNQFGEITRDNGIMLIAPTFTAIRDSAINDTFYKDATNVLVSILEELKADGMINPKYYTHYSGQVFLGYAEGGSLVTYVAQQGLDYADAGFTMQGPLGVALINPLAPLFNAASYWNPPIYLLLYGEKAQQAGISRDYHRRLKNQGAAVYIESAPDTDASITADQITRVAGFVIAAYELESKTSPK